MLHSHTHIKQIPIWLFHFCRIFNRSYLPKFISYINSKIWGSELVFLTLAGAIEMANLSINIEPDSAKISILLVF
jgi:hypothetical protein